MTKVGFLLGAGASYPFGIPMMRELYTDFVKYIERTRPHCYSLVERIQATFGPTADLEALISQLDKIRAIRDGLAVLQPNDIPPMPEIDVADELRGYLDAYLIEVCERFDMRKVRNLLSEFVNFCNDSDAYVFSTNYDRLIETAAAGLAIPCVDGFEQGSHKPESAWTGHDIGLSGVKLVKLHGSVNWYREDGSGAVFRLERGYSLPSHEYRLTHGDKALRPLMIIPTLEKSVLENPYAALLTVFSDALLQLEVLFVIGNSMRDEHIKNTIGARIGELEVVLVNPEADKLGPDFGVTDNVHAAPIGTEDFIAQGVPRLHELAEAVQVADTTHEEVRLVVQNFVDAVVDTSNTYRGMKEDEQVLAHKLKEAARDEKVEIIRNIQPGVHEEILSLLRKSAQYGGSESEQIAAIDSLAELGDTGAVDALYETARGRSSLPVRAEAALALKQIADTTGVDAKERLEHLTATDPIAKSVLETSRGGR